MNDPCYMALYLICEQIQSVTAAKLFRKQKNLDLGRTKFSNGLPMLNLMMKNLRSSNIDIATNILSEILRYPQIGKYIYTLDDYGLSLLDRCLCNTNIHCHDLDITENAICILEMLLTDKRLITVSGKPLALAGTLCSQAVFKILIDKGANPNDSVDSETVTHCVISRNSLLKCQYLFQCDVDLATKWNYRNPIELAYDYGCKRDIRQILYKDQSEYPGDSVISLNTGEPNHCTCQREHTNFHLCAWTKFKTYISNKIIANRDSVRNAQDYKTDALFAVKHNQHFMKACSSEISDMKNAIKNVFDEFSNNFLCSNSLSHMSFTYTLSGSMRDDCNCFGPNEFDAVLTIKEIDDLLFTDGWNYIRPASRSKWKSLCNFDRNLIVVLAAREFYDAFNAECQNYSENNQNKPYCIVQIIFQYMSKISRIKFLWKGSEFTSMYVYVDIVLAFPKRNDKTPFPFGLRCNLFNSIAKGDRHAHYNET